MTQLDNQIGYAEETVYGTRVVPVRFLEFNNESIARDQINRASAGLRKANKAARSDRQSQALKGAKGAVQHDLAWQGFSMLFKHLFGKSPALSQPSVGTAPTAWKHTHTLGDGVGLSLTTQVGRPGVTGPVIQPFDYLGTKLDSGTIGQGLDGYATLDLTLDAQSEDNTQALATAAYPATQGLIDDSMLTVSVNATGFFSKQSSVTIDRVLDVGRFGQRANTKKKEPVPSDQPKLTGSLDGEFEDMTTFNLYKAGTIVPIVFDWVGAIIGGAITYELKITLPACRLEGPQPTTKGPGILDAATPFTVLYDGATEPITLELTTTDTAI